jgi:hypothetical protein
LAWALVARPSPASIRPRVAAASARCRHDPRRCLAGPRTVVAAAQRIAMRRGEQADEQGSVCRMAVRLRIDVGRWDTGGVPAASSQPSGEDDLQSLGTLLGDPLVNIQLEPI